MIEVHNEYEKQLLERCEPPPKRQRLSYSDTITLQVGKEGERYIIHTSIATKSSGFLQAALRNGWKEAQSKVIPLPEARKDFVDVYLHWLYHKEVAINCVERLGPEVDDDAENRLDRSCDLVRLYVFGGFLVDPAFQNAILDAYVEYATEGGIERSFAAVREAWATTSKSSSMRKLILAQWRTEVCDVDFWESYFSPRLPDEFMINLCGELLAENSGRTGVWSLHLDELDICKFHEHADGIEKCARQLKAEKPED